MKNKGLDIVMHHYACSIPYMTSRLQTILYYGVDKQQILEVVLQNHCQGVDRIVPFGSALDMNVYWDGYDIIGQLSRRLQCS